ncbi:TPA: DUF1851 domain-containing protein [Salmonella enterica]|nr:GAD-like domain protein [Salmonella enterica subsp. enterica serovar Claibornei]HAV1239774.1 DUF1851 domain-containing protein [Salmonella enterica]
MRDEYFANFVSKFGEATNTVVAPDFSMKKWRGALPDQLLHYWETEGWSTYHHGLVSIVNPDDYEDIIDMWLEDTFLEERDSYHVIARSGFGSLYVCGEKSGRNIIVDCYNHSIYFSKNNSSLKSTKELNLDIKVFFGISKLKRFDLEYQDGKYLFELATKKCGQLNSDEIFGFEPALILGGEADVSHVVKVNAQVHLALLREFAKPAIYEL